MFYAPFNVISVVRCRGVAISFRLVREIDCVEMVRLCISGCFCLAQISSLFLRHFLGILSPDFIGAACRINRKYLCGKCCTCRTPVYANFMVTAHKFMFSLGLAGIRTRGVQVTSHTLYHRAAWPWLVQIITWSTPKRRKYLKTLLKMEKTPLTRFSGFSILFSALSKFYRRLRWLWWRRQLKTLQEKKNMLENGVFP